MKTSNPQASITPEQKADDERRAAEISERRFVARQLKAVRMLSTSLTEQHRDARLSTFRLYGSREEWERQRVVRDSLVEICKDVVAFVECRGQIFLWGTVGTGKDHMLVACAKAAAMQGITARFLDGERFYTDYLLGDRVAALADAVEPEILVLSDPVGTRQWTEGRQLALRQLINSRWNKARPTWVSCNVPYLTPATSRPKRDFHDRMAGVVDQSLSAEELFGADTLSRLMDGAVVFDCRWPDYRGRRRQQVANINRQGD